MMQSRCFAFISSQSAKIVIFLSCFLLMNMQTALAKPLTDSKHSDSKVVAHKQVKKIIPGTYHYESNYEMTKDGRGNYHSNYKSKKHKWFCCLNWFASKSEPSSKRR